jgi:hypothetical protein
MPARPVLLGKFSKSTTAVFIATHCNEPGEEHGFKAVLMIFGVGGLRECLHH